VSEYHFDARYRERARLDDGTSVVLRVIGPEDKALIREGFARMSPEARYGRFFSSKRELSDAELRYFTEFDGVHHFALGAAREKGDGTEEGLGVARFVQLADDPEAAEAAVAVVDDFQQRGLGRLLLARLVAAARERGITRFRATTLAANPAARALMADLGAEPHGELGSEVLSVEVTLPDLPPPHAGVPESSGLYRLFQAVARGVARVVQSHG
jgi:RimJ/RimL family protein N-acetyltransferase